MDFDENKDYSIPYDENPKDIRAICFSPNGDVLNGNVYKKEILDILKKPAIYAGKPDYMNTLYPP